MRNSQKTFALWFFLIIMAVVFYHSYENRHQTMIQDFNYSKFIEALKGSEVAKVTFKQDSSEIVGEIKPDFEAKYNGKVFSIVGNTSDEGYKEVKSYGITPNYERAESNGMLQSF